jgi:predicted phosphodiesterase
MHILKGKYLNLDGIKTVAILADPGCRSRWKEFFPKLLEHAWRIHKPQLFLVAGDLAIDGTHQNYAEFISTLEAYPSQLAAVPGDHDKPLRTFSAYFGSPRKVIDIGQWRFIGINTSNRLFMKEEDLFLKKHLRSNSMIFSHVPPGIEGWTFHSLGPLSSRRFLSTISRHAAMIRAAFFGHIHAYSREEYAGVPLIATGAAMESFAIKNNQYAAPGFLEMMIFHPATGKLALCKMNIS